MYTFLTDREIASLRISYRCVVGIIELFEIQSTRSLATCHYSFCPLFQAYQGLTGNTCLCYLHLIAFII